MSERKVLNKYYPPEFDPAKIPKLKLAKERQYTVRIMAPFNMQCKVCNEYIYKGKKFNAKTENVHNENYLGLRIYRFYIRCPRCISEVVFKTDPQQTDYTLEQGAIRLFEAAKLYQAAEEKEKKQAEEDAQNPMKLLENRTKDSKLEMEVMENLEELRELNMRQGAINYEEILKQGAEQEALRLKQQEEDDEEEIRKLFGKGGDGIIIKRLDDDDAEDDESPSISKPSPSSTMFKRPTDILTDEVSGPSGAKKQKLADTSSRLSTKSSTKSSSRSFLSGLVKVKKSDNSSKPDQDNATSSTETSPNQTTKPVVAESDTAPNAARLTTKPVEAESNTTTDAAPWTAKPVAIESNNVTDVAPLSIGGTADIEKRTEPAAESDQNSESHSKNSDGDPATVEKEEKEKEEKEKAEKKEEKEKTEEEKEEEVEASFANSIQEGLKKQKVASQKVSKEKSSGLSLLGGYDFSDSDISDSSSDS